MRRSREFPAAVPPPRPGTESGPHLRTTTTLARCIAAREAADYALALIPTVGEEGIDPTTGILAARRLGALTRRYAYLAVIEARMLGADWPSIAARLGMTEAATIATYRDAEDRWRAGDHDAWTPIVLDDEGARVPISGAGPIHVPDVTQAAEELDAYCRRHIPPDPRDRIGLRGTPRRPVSEGLPH